MATIVKGEEEFDIVKLDPIAFMEDTMNVIKEMIQVDDLLTSLGYPRELGDREYVTFVTRIKEALADAETTSKGNS